MTYQIKQRNNNDDDNDNNDKKASLIATFRCKRSVRLSY